MLRNAPAPLHELRIIRGRPVAGNHVNLTSAIDRFLHEIYMFQHAYIDGGHFSCVVTTQNMIHLIQRGEVIITFVIAILDSQSFVRVHVKEGEFTVWEFTCMRH